MSEDGTNLALWSTSQGRRETTVVPRPAEAGVRVRDLVEAVLIYYQLDVPDGILLDDDT